MLEKFLALRAAAGGSGGASSWADLGEEVTEVGGDTLTWDGNTEGLPIADGAPFYLISNNVPTLEDMSNGVVFTAFDKESGEEQENPFNFDIIQMLVNYYGCVPGAGAFIVMNDNTVFHDDELTYTFPQKGVWAMDSESMKLVSLTIPGYTGFVSKQTVIKPIDTKYLPEALQFGETVVKGDTVDFVIDVTGKEAVSYLDVSFYRMVDAVVTPDDLVNGYTLKMALGGQEEALNFEANQFRKLEDSYEAIYIAQEMLLCVSEDNYDVYGGGQLVFPKKGIYLPGPVAENAGVTISLTIPGYGGFESKTVTPMDEKYLPILTSPSGKKFKLSVDDSGAVTATEV